MKHIFLLYSHTRPVISSIKGEVGRQPWCRVVMVPLCWSWELLVHTLGRQGVFCESAACVRWDTPSSTSSLAFWWKVSHSAGNSRLKSDWIVEQPRRHTCGVTQVAVVTMERRPSLGGHVATSHLSDAGLGFWVKRFRLRSRCAHADVFCVVSTQPVVSFWCGCVVSPAPSHLTVTHNNTHSRI